MHMYTDSGGDDDDGSADDGCGGDCGGNDNSYDDGVFAIDLCLCRIYCNLLCVLLMVSRYLLFNVLCF